MYIYIYVFINSRLIHQLRRGSVKFVNAHFTNITEG